MKENEYRIISQFKEPKYVAKITICDGFTIMLEKKPNIFQRSMYKFLLGWKVSEVSNE